jgi:hypothetical protein
MILPTQFSPNLTKQNEIKRAAVGGDVHWSTASTIPLVITALIFTNSLLVYSLRRVEANARLKSLHIHP